MKTLVVAPLFLFLVRVSKPTWPARSALPSVPAKRYRVRRINELRL